MSDKKYPLDITVACSLGLEGGLARYRDVLPEISNDDFDLVHEWNRALKKTMKQPEFRACIDTSTRILLNLPATQVSKIIDKISVPYRSYYYAKRFIDAANFVYDRAGVCANIVDFGRGLSPWGHVVRKNLPYVEMYSIDKHEANMAFQSTSEKMNLPVPIFIDDLPDNTLFDQDIVVSLGTFVYLDDIEQKANLVRCSRKFKNLFIELEKPNADQADKTLIHNMGTSYNRGLSKDSILSAVGNKIPFKLQNLDSHVKNARLARALKNSTEMFLVR